MSQCWPRSISPYGISRSQWVKHRISWVLKKTATGICSCLDFIFAFVKLTSEVLTVLYKGNSINFWRTLRKSNIFWGWKCLNRRRTWPSRSMPNVLPLELPGPDISFFVFHFSWWNNIFVKLTFVMLVVHRHSFSTDRWMFLRDHFQLTNGSSWVRYVCKISACYCVCPEDEGLILGLCPPNERWRYFVTTSLIGWAQSYNQPCILCWHSHHQAGWSNEEMVQLIFVTHQ